MPLSLEVKPSGIPLGVLIFSFRTMLFPCLSLSGQHDRSDFFSD